MTFDLYVWSSPRDLDEYEAQTLIDGWQQGGGDPALSPFETSTDVGWFHRELRKDAPDLAVATDATPRANPRPILLETEPEVPARVVAIRLTAQTPEEVLEDIYALAAKYDLVLFDARSRRLHLPLGEMSAYASATFWPAGAIQAAVAGGAGGAIAVIAWLVGIPILSGVIAVIGGFMFVMAIVTFVHEVPRAMAGRSRDDPPPEA
jgi:hypothetical protein